MKINFSRDHFIVPDKKLVWLNQIREAALLHFNTTGFPSRHDEDWRYTNVNAISEKNFQLPQWKNKQDNKKSWQLNNDIAGARLVFVNGHYAESLSTQALDKKIILTDMHTALEKYPELLQPHLAHYTDQTANAFAALNCILMTNGTFLYIPDDMIIDESIQLIFIQDTAEQMVHVRNLVVAGKNSQAQIIEKYMGTDANIYFTNTVTELVLEANAKVTHIKLQQEGDAAYHIGQLQIVQGKDSEVEAHSFALGGKLVRSDTHVAFNAEGAYCKLNGLFMGCKQQHVDHHTCIYHAKPRCTSEEYYKGIMADSAKGVFNGKVIVALDAQKTNARQYNKNLLLSRQAEINTKPELQIYADDVQCTHGATVGQLDEEALFFLRSRGLTEVAAKQILIRAFAEEMLEMISLPSLKMYLKQAVNNYDI